MLAMGTGVMANEDIKVALNGKTLEFDVAPQMANECVLIPLRAVTEEMGAEVGWDNDTQTVTVTLGDTVMVLTIGSTTPTVNGTVVAIDQPAILVGGRTLAPLAFVAKSFGASVEWDGDSQTVNITLVVAVEEAVSTENQEAAANEAAEATDGATKLLYQGHGSFRITAQDGTVMYVDPFAGEGYDVPADIILVTHQHYDHNVIELITQNPDCMLISNVEALEGGKHNTFTIGSIVVEAVQAYNSNHDVKECVGFVITVDGIKIYIAGDTSKTDDMKKMAAMKLDYAFLPCDGVYNMDLKEAAECAVLIGAKINVPMHMLPGELFSREIAEKYEAPNRLIVEAGEEIEL